MYGNAQQICDALEVSQWQSLLPSLCDGLASENLMQHLFHILNVHKLDPSLHALRDILFDVCAVGARGNNCRDTGTMSGKDLFFKPANWKDLSNQRNLPCQSCQVVGYESSG